MSERADFDALLFAMTSREKYGEQIVFDAGWPADHASRLGVLLVWQRLPCCERTRIARAWLELEDANPTVAGAS